MQPLIMVLIVLAILVAIAYVLGSLLVFILMLFTKNLKQVRSIRNILFCVFLILELLLFIQTYLKRGIAAEVKPITDKQAADPAYQRIKELNWRCTAELNKLMAEDKITDETYGHALSQMATLNQLRSEGNITDEMFEKALSDLSNNH